MSWHPPLKKNKIRERFAEGAREVALVALERIVFRTPVRYGYARANWHVSVGRTSSATFNRAFPTLNPSLNLRRIAEGETIWIQNNVSYIIPLEYGHSKRSPEGMVRKTVAELGAI